MSGEAESSPTGDQSAASGLGRGRAVNPSQDVLDVAELIIRLSTRPTGGRRLHLLTFIADAIHRGRHGGEALLVAAFHDREDGPISPRLDGALRNNDPATSVGGRVGRLSAAATDSVQVTMEQFALSSDDELLDWIDWWSRHDSPPPAAPQ